MTRGLLRVVAIAIAVLALIDPEFIRSQTVGDRLAIVAIDDASVVAAARLRDALADYSSKATTWKYQSSSAAAACPSEGNCLLVSSGSTPNRITAGAKVQAVVKVQPEGSHAPLLDRIDAPRRVHVSAAAMLRVHTTRPARRIEVFDRDRLVGEAEPGAETSVDVEWVPVEEGARALRVVVDDETADVGVVVDAGRASVLFYEPQATWLGTFVRRAMDDDVRFELRGRTRVSPPVAITRGQTPSISERALDDVQAIVVASPELLTGSEVDLLERFVSRRGGSLVLLSDTRPSGAALRLLPRVVAERQDAKPRSMGSLRATEWLTFAPAFGVSALASIDEQPVIVTRALGRGRVIASGALDAWRFRQGSDGFNAFWTSLVWEAASIAGPTLRIDADRVIARPGDEVRVNVELQPTAAMSLGDLPVMNAAGSVTCGDSRQFLRLWPSAGPGTFRGTVRIDRASECVVTASVNDTVSTLPLTIRDDFHVLSGSDEALEAIASAHGAPFITGDADGEAEIAARLQKTLATHQVTVTHRPMRSPYWLLPFVLCLAGEWWLRRRSGLS